MAQNKLNLRLNWLNQSPEFNLMEMFLADQKLKSSTVAELKQFCKEKWAKIPPQWCEIVFTALQLFWTENKRMQRRGTATVVKASCVAPGLRHHKDKRQVFSLLSSHVPQCCLLSTHTHTHRLLWMDAFYSLHRREIHFYFAWLLLPAGQLSCYCHCYIGGTNGSDRSVFAEPGTMQLCIGLCGFGAELHVFNFLNKLWQIV